ncbi:MAG: carboxypeptidase regulatory-like domain-containing protein [Betaproteobacteria bacterium]|nr:MAG: carboxypeptidase regulatory-like domain-containing protein [Betaproteobacteria bacterium]
MNASAFLPTLAALVLAGAALAQPLAVRESEGARFVSGGVGEEERAQLTAMRAAFNLHLIFAAARGGNYLADVSVVLRDATGRDVLATNTEGPWFLAQVAPGRYTLIAEYGGKIQTRALAVPASGHAEMFLYWDDPAALEGRGMEPERERKTAPRRR